MADLLSIKSLHISDLHKVIYKFADKSYICQGGAGVKKRDVEKALEKLGFRWIGGTKHDKWSNGDHVETVPRHSEINELTAKAILKRAAAAAERRNAAK